MANPRLNTVTTKTHSNDREQPKSGMLVEDSSVVAGTDASGAPVIRPKTPAGRADESVNPTDPREKPLHG